MFYDKNILYAKDIICPRIGNGIWFQILFRKINCYVNLCLHTHTHN